MKLIKLIDYNTKALIKCGLCGLEHPWNLASKKGWVLDADNDIYYCPECISFLINDLDDSKTIC